MSKHSKKQLKSKENTQNSLQSILPERSETSLQVLAPTEKTEVKDQYVATGNFIKDYAELCTRLGIEKAPPIVARGRRPTTPTLAANDLIYTNKEQNSKSKDKKQQPAHEKDAKENREKRKVGASPSVKEDTELKESDLPPSEWKTFSVRDTWAHMKPAIQIESDSIMPETNRRQHDVEPIEVVYEIYITGWKIDAPMMDVLRSCWPALEKLHTVTLWNVGLTGETTELLAEKLQLMSSLKVLNLDGNAQNSEQNFHLLISPKNQNNLQKLSLRHCAIDDRGAQLLAESLAVFTVEQFSVNSKLMSLNLASNKITDRGAASLAKALRFNRTLLMLTLSDNQIGDYGACAFASTIAKFALEMFEICERRRMLAKRREMMPSSAVPVQAHPTKRGAMAPSRMNTSKQPEKATRKKDAPESTKKGKSEKDKEKPPPTSQKSGTKDEKSAGQDHSGKKSQMGVGPPTKLLPSKGGGRESKKSNIHTPISVEQTEVIQKEEKGPMAPLLDDLTAENDPDRWYLPWQVDQDLRLVVPTSREQLDKFVKPYDIIVRGNYCLANLNLARNRIGKFGTEMLLMAVKYQAATLQAMPNSLVNYGANAGQFDIQLLVTGMLRMPVNGNLVSTSDLIYRELAEFMATKEIFIQLLSKKQGVAMPLGSNNVANNISLAQVQSDIPTPSLTPVVPAEERQV